jgi:hypothetical protein
MTTSGKINKQTNNCWLNMALDDDVDDIICYVKQSSNTMENSLAIYNK